MKNPASHVAAATPSATFRPYIPAAATLREFTPRAVILGALLGMVFGASSLYLVLKVGMTVSASIPVAVISLTLFRLWSKLGRRDATILENNIVATAGSAGESIAFGLGVTMPAILILGFDLEVVRVMQVALLGGLLGILMMIPLRRALIVQQHGVLKYPEGTACAQVLMAAADPESRAAAAAAVQPALPAENTAPARAAVFSARDVFVGFGLGLAYKTLMSALKLWKDIPQKVFGAPFKNASVSAEISPELLGVGYIIGPRIASIMMAGGACSYLLLIPLISFFGDAIPGVLPPGGKPISEMSPGAIRGAYVLYIGAGAVAMGGIISLVRSLPIIIGGIRSGLADFRRAAAAHVSVSRTDRDLSMKVVAGGILLLLALITCAPALHMNLLGALLIVAFGFLFVTVSSRLTGEIGSSSNPVSGMTVATLLLTCLIFLLVGWTGGTYYVTALSVGGIVCIAASNGGNTSQDLKRGFLVGATPRRQQIAILVGTTASALVLGPVLVGLNQTGTVYVPAAQVAPGLRAPELPADAPRETLRGRQAVADTNTYRVWHKRDAADAPAGKYLVDESGKAVWLVDPGINGVYSQLPDGTVVQKFDAPKATLMSYIIKGMLDRELPWSLVLFGVMISLVMELCGVSSLVFAVGVYLPISSSAPIFVGGLVRWLVDRQLRRRVAARNLDEAQLAVESDRSPGVLLASGYIAGGAIAGILIAFLAGVLGDLDAAITRWSSTHNPFFAGAYADPLALLPFALLAGWLYLTGRRSRPG